MKKYFLLTCLLSSIISLNSYAQDLDNCKKSNIIQARENYKIGKFSDAINLLNKCVSSSTYSTNEKIQVHHVIILSYIALDYLEAATFYIEELLKIAPDFSPDIDDPISLWNLIEKVKNKEQNNIVYSLSGRAEDLKKSAATIIVIKEEEIIERGYGDINELFTDLPSFYVNYNFGSDYSNIFLRGFRAADSQKILFLIDGVSLNDPWSRQSFVAPQIPLNNIQKIEIIYGPSSTMYGFNATSGVINIITKSQNDEHDLDVNISTGYGNMNTYFGEVYLKKKFKDLNFNITGKYHRSDLNDLSNLNQYNYNPSIFNGVDYENKMALSGDKARNFVSTYSDLLANENLTIQKNPQGIIETIKPSSIGIQNALFSDSSAIVNGISNQSLSYDNSMELLYLNANAKLANFNIGLNLWGAKLKNTNDGTSYSLAGNYANWQPSQSIIHASYNKKHNSKLSYTNLLSYKISNIRPSSSYTLSESYANGTLGLNHLITNTKSSFNVYKFSHLSKEFNNNFRIYYSPLWNLNLFGGIDFVSASIQDSYSVSSPSNTLIKLNSNNRTLDYLQIGSYAQVEFLLNNEVKLVGGLRLDHNKINKINRNENLFSYRAALVYSPKNFTIKLITSSADALPSIKSLLNTSIFRRINNPDLKTEKSMNFEALIDFKVKDKLNFTINGFYNLHDNVISEVFNSDSSSFQLQNIGKATILGTMFIAKYTSENMTLESNYSYQHSSIKNNGTISFSDIPQHQLNLILNNKIHKKLNVNTRFHYLSKRKTGLGTNVPFNSLNTLPSTFLIDLTLSYKNLLPGLSAQLIGKNILNTQYAEPGRASADGVLRASSIPQNGTSIILRLNYQFSSSD